MEKKKCEKCGAEGTSYNSGLCEHCYAKNWDESFSSQADYSDKMLEEQEKEQAEENKKINKANPSDKDIKDVLGHYWTGTVICSKCKFHRIPSKKYRKLSKEGKLVDEAKKPCPKCGAKGFLYRL